MRQGQQNHHNNKRMRGRNNRKGPNPLTRSYESNGGDVKICGTALHIAEKYVQLARDAHSSGDRVASENYFQHAEHYYRMVAAAQAQMPQPQPVFRSDGDNEEDEDRADGDSGFGRNQGNYQGNDQPTFGMAADPQPYVNGNGQGAGPERARRAAPEQRAERLSAAEPVRQSRRPGQSRDLAVRRIAEWSAAISAAAGGGLSASAIRNRARATTPSGCRDPRRWMCRPATNRGRARQGPARSATRPMCRRRRLSSPIPTCDRPRTCVVPVGRADGEVARR